MLSRDQLLAIGTTAEFETRTIEGVGEIGIRRFSGADQSALLDFWESKGGEQAGGGAAAELQAVVLVYGLCDSNGDRVFEMENLGALTQWHMDQLTATASAILEYNGMTEEAAAATEGNSGGE